MAAERPYPHPSAREGLTGSVADLAEDTGKLVQLELQLLRQEIFELLKRNAFAVGFLIGAGICFFVFLILLLVTVVMVVPFDGQVTGHAITAGVITAIFLVLAVTLALVGKSRIKFAPPQRSIESIREDMQWLKQQIKPGPR